MLSTAVLVAEDEPLLRAVLAEFLREEGYEVLDVANGRLALDLARQRRVDVIVTDIRMPALSGRELYEALRLFQRDLCEAFIVITGWDDAETEFFRRMNVPVIRKPFALAVLREAIEAVLRRRSRPSAENSQGADGGVAPACQ